MSSSRPSDPPLLPLGCPSCGAGLDPLRDDILFLCPACGAASELEGTTTVRRDLVHATPGAGPSCLHLPFWRLPGPAMSPAFNGSRLLTVSRWYTERIPAIEARTGGPAPRGLWGGRIGARDAPRIAALAAENARAAGARSATVLTELPKSPERAKRVEGSEPKGESKVAPALLAVPFYREPSRLVCAITGLHLYLETLEGSAELLARWEKLFSGR